MLRHRFKEVPWSASMRKSPFCCAQHQRWPAVKALLEQGLRHVLSERKTAGAFRLRKATVRGRGLQSGVAHLSWDRIRDLAYEGRGG